MSYYSRRSGASFGDPDYYRNHIPGFIFFIGFFLGLLLVITFMIWLKIYWGWFFLLWPVVSGILLALTTSQSKTTRRIVSVIYGLLGFSLAFFCVALLLGVGFGFVAGVIAAMLVWVGLSNNYDEIRANQETADYIEKERHKRFVEEDFESGVIRHKPLPVSAVRNALPGPSTMIVPAGCLQMVLSDYSWTHSSPRIRFGYVGPTGIAYATEGKHLTVVPFRSVHHIEVNEDMLHISLYDNELYFAGVQNATYVADYILRSLR